MIHLLRAFLWLELQLARQHRSALIAQIVQFLVFLFVFARLPINSQESFLAGVPYVHYVLTGFVYQIFYEAIMNGPTSRLSELQQTGQLQVVLSAPYPRWMILLAAGVGSSLNGIFRALIIFFAGSLIFGADIGVVSWPDLVLALTFTSVLCMCLALLNIAGALLWPRINLTSFFSSLLLGLLSGVFVPIDRLPSLLQPIAVINPLRWGLDVFRHSLGQHAALAPSGWLYAGVSVMILMVIATLLYRRADTVLTTENRYQNF
jgi:ABC-type polysaccharide/polyol phosphate export permease